MKLLIAIILAFAVGGTASFAQPVENNAAPPAPSGGVRAPQNSDAPAPPDHQAGAPAAAGRASVKELRQKCAADERAKGLRGPALRTAVQDCLVKARPALAGVMACRKEGIDKGLKGAELKDYVQSCRRNTPPKVN